MPCLQRRIVLDYDSEARIAERLPGRTRDQYGGVRAAAVAKALHRSDPHASGTVKTVVVPISSAGAFASDESRRASGATTFPPQLAKTIALTQGQLGASLAGLLVAAAQGFGSPSGNGGEAP